MKPYKLDVYGVLNTCDTVCDFYCKYAHEEDYCRYCYVRQLKESCLASVGECHKSTPPTEQA